MDQTAVEETTGKIGYLSEMDLFRDLSKEDMAWLDHLTNMVECRKGQLIYSPEEAGEILFLLKKGVVQIYRLSPEGKKLVIGTLGPGTFFGEMSLFGQGMYESFAEASEDAILCAMRRSHLEQLILAKPNVALRLLHVLGERLRASQRALEELALKPVPSRVASLLLRLSEESGPQPITGLTHQDLADMAGTLRETATEILNHFKAAGFIEIQRMRIKILNAEGLSEIARGR